MELTIVKYTEASNMMGEIDMDDDDFDIEKYDEEAKALMTGIIVVKYKGNGESVVEFVHLKMQKDPHGRHDGN